MTPLEVTGVVVQTRRGATPLHNFSVAAGETVIGSWRYALAHLMPLVLGLARPPEGSVALLGQDPYRLARNDQMRLRGRCGVLPSDTSPLISNLSVIDNISLPLRYHHERENQDPVEVMIRVRAAMEEHGIGGLASLRPWQLSLDDQRLVALVRSLVARPELLIIEDPFTGTSDEATERILRLVNHHVEHGGCALLATEVLGARIGTEYNGVLTRFHNGRVATLGAQ
jgi:ABC-type transporter Mla maintaining outer membrane lipid asymmetry ATPase subunit MlaF